jgi:hypothetical protein
MSHPSDRLQVDEQTFDSLSSGDYLIDLKRLNNVKITRRTSKPVLSACSVIIFGPWSVASALESMS